jgi:hypothetical protein
VIVRNSARCLVCRHEVESRHAGDAVTCTCGNLTVDGGLVRLARVYGLPESHVDTSTVIADDDTTDPPRED